jgi:hypothetical protein
MQYNTVEIPFEAPTLEIITGNAQVAECSVCGGQFH